MASAIDIAELIARPLDVIARLRVELKARGNSNNSGEQESAFLAAAISEALCSGASPALDEVPVLCRHSLAEVWSVVLPVLSCYGWFVRPGLQGERKSEMGSNLRNLSGEKFKNQCKRNTPYLVRSTNQQYDTTGTVYLVVFLSLITLGGAATVCI